jgi:hypothetical protein
VTALPAVPPELVADTVDALPGRLRKRLDEFLATARSWPVEPAANGVLVTVDEQTTAPVTGPDDVRCSCLMAPKCLHRAAVLSLATVSGSSTVDTEPAPSTVDEDQVVLEVGDRERAAALALWRAGSGVVAAGIPGSGAVPQAALLRAAHEARALKLPRAASAAVRVVEELRAALREDASFRLGRLVADLRELLYVSHALRCGVPLRGVARRDYRAAGNERLYGLCCEPVVTTSGYAGAVTYLVDRTGRCWQVGTVTPGDVELARVRTGTPVSVGEVRLTHRELGRAGLVAADLRASADGRISTGKGTKAVRSDGVAWTDEPLDALWRQPVPDQLARYHTALDLPPTERPAGHDLLFVEGTVAGAVRDGVLVELGGGTVLTVTAPTDSPRLSYVDNLRVVGASTGTVLRLVGRPAGRGRIAAIAAGGAWYEDRHVDLGVDKLRRSDLPPAVPREARVREPVDLPPLHLLRRRVERAVERGRSGVPGDARDADRLRAAALPTAADLVGRIEEACRIDRDPFGRITTPDGESLADAWLAAAVYLVAADRSIERSTFG